jgi:antitoxin MazE
MYILEVVMQVAKWGNSLAIRLPAAVVAALGLKAGDDVEVNVVGGREFRVKRKLTPEEALEKLRTMRGMLPADFVFDRDEANAR